MTSTADQACIDATRIWLEQAVIGLNLCPFAKTPYRQNRVRFRVARARHLDAFLQILDHELQHLAATPVAELETTLLIVPQLFEDFYHFNDMLDLAEQAVSDNGLEGIVQIAPFHPQFVFADTEKDDMGNYTNRSPYPTLHLLREDSIAEAADSVGDPARIFERNIALLHRLGRAGWQALAIPEPAPPEE